MPVLRKRNRRKDYLSLHLFPHLKAKTHPCFINFLIYFLFLPLYDIPIFERIDMYILLHEIFLQRFSLQNSTFQSAFLHIGQFVYCHMQILRILSFIKYSSNGCSLETLFWYNVFSFTSECSKCLSYSFI